MHQKICKLSVLVQVVPELHTNMLVNRFYFFCVFKRLQTRPAFSSKKLVNLAAVFAQLLSLQIYLIHLFFLLLECLLPCSLSGMVLRFLLNLHPGNLHFVSRSFTSPAIVWVVLINQTVTVHTRHIL